MTFGLALRVALVALAIGTWGGGAIRAAAPAERGVLPIEVVDVETGRPVQLEAGPKVLHLVVFATWCRPCEDELALLAEWETRFGAAGYRVVIVALSERQSRDRLLGFARERRPPGRLYLDTAGRLEKALGVDGVPAHYLLDAQGRVTVKAGSIGEISTATVEEMLGERSADPGRAR